MSIINSAQQSWEPILSAKCEITKRGEKMRMKQFEFESMLRELKKVGHVRHLN